MKKIIIYISIFIASFLWFLGCSNSLTQTLFEKDLIKDDFRYGDLYRLSNLPQFKEKQYKCKSVNVSLDSNLSLFIAGDSFTEKERIDSSDFGVKNYTRVYGPAPDRGLKLQSGKNILIIESVERHFRERFEKPYTATFLVSDAPKVEMKSIIKKALEYNLPYSEPVHHNNLFAFDFILKIKEWKASFHQKVFGKVDNRVCVSADEKHIFYYLDKQKGSTNGFEAIPDSSINKYVQNLNVTYDYYKKMGFDEVYFSIIPNKSSVIEPGLDYNKLISKIETHPKLMMPFITVWDAYAKAGASVYAVGDSHWNCQGRQIWLDAVKTKLK